MKADGTAVTKQSFDATSLLTIFLVAVFVIPANFVVGPLGAAGRPSMLVGVVAFGWWGVRSVSRNRPRDPGVHQVRIAAIAFLLAVMVSYVAAFVRSIDAVEGRSADRGIILLLGLLGPLLLAADYIPSRERFETLMGRLTTGGAALAAVGILQFFTRFDLSRVLRFPLLTEHSVFQGNQERSDLARVSGTASHPIEFGVVLGIIFPIALHYALHPKGNPRFAWLRVALIAIAVPLSVSRSGSLAIGITFLVLWVTWPSRLRFRSAVIAAVGAVAMRAVVPGLLGTIKSLFTNLLYDPSTQGRLNDYGTVERFFGQRPLIGRGFATFMSDRYIILDNQYLGLLIETGFIGTFAFVMLFVVSIGTARTARRGADDETRSLGQALIASAIAVLVSAGTFDLLGFSMVAGIAFLLVGCSGGLWKLTATKAEDLAELTELADLGARMARAEKTTSQGTADTSLAPVRRSSVRPSLVRPPEESDQA